MKIKRNILLIGFTFFVLAGCKDFYDVKPTNKLASEDHYLLKSDVQNAAIGIYSSIRPAAERLLILSELMSDMATTTPNSSEQLYQIDRFTAKPSYDLVNPKPFFNLIVNCNDFIKRAPEYRKKDSTNLSNAEYQAHMLNAYSARAWAYLNIAKLYGSVPYFEDNLTSVEKLNDPSLYTVLTFEQTVKKLIDQLEAITVTYPNPMVDIAGAFPGVDASWNRIPINIQAVKMELYLWKAAFAHEQGLNSPDYQTAFQIGVQLLDKDKSDNFKLTATYSNGSWVSIFTNGVTSSLGEFYTGAGYQKSANQQNSLQYLFSNTAPNSYQIAPTTKCINLFKSQNDTWRGENYSFKNSTTLPEINKYSLGKTAYSLDAGIFITRAPEIFLMLSEGLNGLNLTNEALVLINQGLKPLYNAQTKTYTAPVDPNYTFTPTFLNNIGIRGRVALNSLAMKPVDTNKDGLVNAADSVLQVHNFIAQETASELSFEGKRWFTLMRIALQRNDNAFLANEIAGSFSAGEADAIRNRLMDSKKWFLPNNWW